MTTLTIAGLEKAIQDKRGNLAAIGRQFGVTRQAVAKRVHGSAKLQKAWNEARETMLDNAETELYEQVLGGNIAALIFFLKTQGKSRGYVERQELTGADNGPLVIEYVNDWRSHQED